MIPGCHTMASVGAGSVGGTGVGSDGGTGSVGGTGSLGVGVGSVGGVGSPETNAQGPPLEGSSPCVHHLAW